MALLVAIAHLWRGQIDPAAHYGVFCFFIISGYLITRILCETYAFSASGLARFALNRFLRLYPAYAVVFLLSLGLLFFASAEALNYSGGMLQMNDANWQAWLYNIIILLSIYTNSNKLFFTKLIINILLFHYLLLSYTPQ